ncbi:MAG: permease [Planctomycetota bacterium]
MEELVARFGVALGGVLGDAGLWLIAGFGVAGLLHAFVPASLVARQLGRRGTASVLKGAVIGAPLPLCSCSVIPAAAALRRGGASKGAAASFAVATPEIDVPAFSLTWALLGPVMAAARVIGAAVSAVTAGLLVDAVSRDEDSSRLPVVGQQDGGTRECCRSHGTAHDHGHHHGGFDTDQDSDQDIRVRRTLVGRVGQALRYGFVDLPADLAGWLIIGLLASAAVGAFLPPDLLTGSLGAGPLAVMAAMGLGLVVYVCATGTTPLVAVLVAKGLGPGPALAFLLAGPATNPATMAWVLKDLGRSAFAAYVGAIGAVAFVSGWGLQWLATGAWTPEPAPLAGHAGSSALGGAALAALLAFAFVHPLARKLLASDSSGDSCCGCGGDDPGGTESIEPEAAGATGSGGPSAARD